MYRQQAFVASFCDAHLEGSDLEGGKLGCALQKVADILETLTTSCTRLHLKLPSQSCLNEIAALFRAASDMDAALADIRTNGSEPGAVLTFINSFRTRLEALAVGQVTNACATLFGASSLLLTSSPDGFVFPCELPRPWCSVVGGAIPKGPTQ